MKTIILSAVAAAALAAPVFATPNQIANEIFAQSHETGDGPKGVRFQGAGGDLNAALAHFDQSHDTGDGPRVRTVSPTEMVISSKNGDLSTFAASKLDTLAGEGDRASGESF